jgi:hypothetical protein
MITGIAKGFLNLKNLTDLLIIRSFPFKILSPFGKIQDFNSQNTGSCLFISAAFLYFLVAAKPHCGKF